MKRSVVKKIALVTILALFTLLSVISLWIYTTPPGLHYLLIIFAAIGMIVLVFFYCLISNSLKNHGWYSLALFGIALINGLPVVFDGQINWETRCFGGGTLLLGMAFQVFLFIRIIGMDVNTPAPHPRQQETPGR